MLTEDRHQRVLSHVRKNGSASITVLSKLLDVSEATIRRDLDTLAEAGLVRRVRGGACDVRSAVRPEPDLVPFADVANQASTAKQAVAARAVSTIKDGDVIALDIGTTVAAMCPLLMRRNITVATASTAVISCLESASGIDLIILGGLLRPNYRSMVGTLTEAALRQIRVDKAYLGTSGVRSDGAVLDSTPSEVGVKQGLLAASSQSYLLADNSKFPGTGFLHVCDIDDFAGLVTDLPLPADALPEGTELEVLIP